MTDNKDYDSIIRGITRGLTGNAKTDISYLQEQIETFKDHEFGKEIVRACGRLMYELIPDDKKEKLANLIDNESSGTEAVLEEVRFNIYKKNFDKALRIMETLVAKIEKLNAFEDDQVSEYRVFDETFEEILYQYRTKTKKDIRRAQIPYTEIYLLYGSLLVELKRFPDAQQALQKGLHWNPVNFSITTEYIETYKMTGDLERFFDLTKEAFKIAFRSADVGRCYRNLGFYFVEKSYGPRLLPAICSACNLTAIPNRRSQNYTISIPQLKVKFKSRPLTRQRTMAKSTGFRYVLTVISSGFPFTMENISSNKMLRMQLGIFWPLHMISQKMRRLQNGLKACRRARITKRR